MGGNEGGLKVVYKAKIWFPACLFPSMVNGGVFGWCKLPSKSGKVFVGSTMDFGFSCLQATLSWPSWTPCFWLTFALALALFLLAPLAATSPFIRGFHTALVEHTLFARGRGKRKREREKGEKKGEKGVKE